MYSKNKKNWNVIPTMVSDNMKRKPKYCESDGTVLYEERKYFPQGYDAYTGEKLPDSEHIYLRCENKEHITYLQSRTVDGKIFWHTWWL